ncbi:MAG: 50S ribosomal protein L25 [Anaerolineae bacterium]|nr:50S ribosomal protein L25 [Anaerolineae bacterium]
MDKVVIPANKRGIKGKKVKLLRAEGKLPGVIYGSKMEPLPISLDLKEATKTLRATSSSSLLYIDVDGEEYTTLVRERQRDFIRGTYLHIDFLAVSLTEKVRAMVNISIEGDAPALETYDSLLTTGVDQLDVESLPQDLPEKISVDVSGLEEIGDGIYVRDLEIPDNIDVFTDGEELVVVISAVVLIEEEVEEEELDEELEEGEEVDEEAVEEEAEEEAE